MCLLSFATSTTSTLPTQLGVASLERGYAAFTSILVFGLISLGFCRIITAVEDIGMWFPDVGEGTGGRNDIGWEGAGVL